MTTNFEDVKIAPLSMIIKNIPYTIVNQREREREIEIGSTAEYMI